ncbi:helix-turn-helix domain-containing protein [Denitrobacterium detoxificans]|jgi:transcriptional regulator with XRE-family HTH domain|uniref:helix-turn-helix domain-containing protein n=1 Tax=Denitrobacterium detoxificans TaxID=79604 RepID=UPI0026EF93AB|nr:helix-turn-helix transcriptional regulator [Denitrobacterium detoxificans]MBE6465803.1 helix-turn-helix transcriptional regulator [Denitrobacterium detoxificans]
MPSFVGKRIELLLREKGMSQKELAEKTNLTPAAVSRYISGAREPRPITIAAIAKVLDVTTDEIIGTKIEQETDEAIRLIARNANNLTEAQREELIAALAKR